PPRDGGELDLALELGTTEAAAFWHAGQSIAGTLTVRNDGADDVTASLAAAADVPGVVIDLPGEATVKTGETLELPVTLRLPSDLPDQAPLLIQLSAAGGSSRAVASQEVALRCEAAPVSPFPYWSVPDGLLGRPNVLLAGLG